jgi:protein-S-isoprenylcysteine O-methyltransferase Ste14
MEDATDTPRVPLIPPLAFIIAIGCAAVLEWGIPLSGLFRSWQSAAVGSALVLAGFAIAGSSFIRFRAAGTSVRLDKPASALVETGPYRYTRNPIYLGLVVVYLGVAAVLTSIWVLLFLPLFVAYLRYGVIAYEEAYLRRRFGAAYEEFMARVPRWL